MQIHDSVHTSILSSDSGNIPFRGLVHLLVLILMTYTVRALIDSLEKHNFVLIKEVSCFTDFNILGVKFYQQRGDSRSFELSNTRRSLYDNHLRSVLLLD
jgi:predicted ABC-type exoprotein transport system permease subunit